MTQMGILPTESQMCVSSNGCFSFVEDMGTTNVNRLGSIVALVTSRGFQWIPGCQRVTVSVQFSIVGCLPTSVVVKADYIPILCGFLTRKNAWYSDVMQNLEEPEHHFWVDIPVA